MRRADRRRARSAARRGRKVVDLVDGGIGGGEVSHDESDDVIVRIGVEEESASSTTDGGTNWNAIWTIHKRLLRNISEFGPSHSPHSSAKFSILQSPPPSVQLSFMDGPSN